MLFSSNIFIFIFLPVALLGFQLASRFGRTALFSWLAFISLVFYGYWDARFLILLCGSILMNFLFSRQLITGSDKKKTTALTIAITANLALLVYFKYLFPLLAFAHTIGLHHRNFGEVILPLGISFFTFTQIAYLIDLRQGVAQPQGLLSYTLFVSFFPHLIAGPIVHHSEMMPQFNHPRTKGLNAADMSLGLTWFILGLAKKVLIADTLAPLADVLYRNPHGFGLTATWLGTLAYALQLYFDFSGYSDMALGLARCFSIEFPVNFNSPFKAANIIDFWQRWHMTLTRYLTLYLYNPIALAINRRRVAAGKKISKKSLRTAEGFFQLIAFPTLLTMFLAGIWHGAGLQFILFGVAHGLYLSVNHAWRVFIPVDSPLQKLLPRPVGVAITFLCVLVGQVFFRAISAGSAFYILATMIGLHGKGASLAGNPYAASIGPTSRFLTHPAVAALSILACLAICWALPNTQELLGQQKHASPSLFTRLQWRPTLAWWTSVSALFVLALMLLQASTSFLYFQF